MWRSNHQLLNRLSYKPSQLSSCHAITFRMYQVNLAIHGPRSQEIKMAFTALIARSCAHIQVSVGPKSSLCFSITRVISYMSKCWSTVIPPLQSWSTSINCESLRRQMLATEFETIKEKFKLNIDDCHHTSTTIANRAVAADRNTA